MPNPYFRFKSFTVYHDQCAMKVCTDACIFGAWLAAKSIDAKKILDIGAGSGLLTLMIAQKTTADLDAIELDESSHAQLRQNIISSPWKERIKILQGDAVSYSFPGKYDLIISNPPFYENELRSPDGKKNMAMHDTGLTLEALVDIIDRQLTPEGNFSVLLPFHRTAYFLQIAEAKGFYLSGTMFIRQTPKHAFFRSILQFNRQPVQKKDAEEMIIKDNGAYTNAFEWLLRDYYLQL